jgi:2-polyprenyl-3-methyl-5-hydroxy-6-metoxy-1,4-benzoquinol methylase
MKRTPRWVGLDVHAETIAVAVADKDGSVQSVGTIPNRPDAVRRAMKKLENGGKLHVCYEAGPCGYGLYWRLAEMGIECEGVAPTLIPVKTGDRVKTDRRDAEKLARLLRSGDLTAVWVPDADQQALRDLVRARHAAKRDQLRHRNRLGRFLLQLDVRRPEKIVSWGTKHMASPPPTGRLGAVTSPETGPRLPRAAMPTNYTPIAATFDRRYALNDYSGVERTVRTFLAGTAAPVLEVGCGTGHWLAFAAAEGVSAVGLDASEAMLARARERLPARSSRWVEGRAFRSRRPASIASSA